MAAHRDGTRRRLDDRVDALGLLDLTERARPPVSEADLDSLPLPAQRWLRRVGVVGRSPVRSLRARFTGAMRMKPEQAWMPLEAWQLNTVDPIARIFQMRIDAAHVIPMFGVDSYVDHVGYMRGKVLGLITVADGSGPEFDLGELVTWVNDAVLLAPSMLLGPHTRWTAVDDRSFDLTVSDADNVVVARVVIGEDDLVTDFLTEDRWFAGTDPPTRTPWHTPVPSWTTSPAGDPVPGEAQAVWSFPDGDFAYIRGEFDALTLEFDVA